MNNWHAFRERRKNKVFRPDSAFIATAMREFKKTGGSITMLDPQGDGSIFFSATEFLFTHDFGGIYD